MRLIRLLLPALFPSWRFFREVGPSPRVEVLDPATGAWRDLAPRPARLSLPATIGRLVWNPRWNEHLFLVACAERLIEDRDAATLSQLRARIDAVAGPRPFRIRLVGAGADGSIVFQCAPGHDQ